MSRWQIRVPHRALGESLASAAAHARDLGCDSEWMRQLMLDALGAGDRTVGDLLERLERMDPGERRRLIDAARAELGLEATAIVDEREQREALQRTRVPPPAFTVCAHPSCSTVPARYGIAYHPDVKRWHCPAHEHLAQPGDLEPRGLGIRISESGVLVPADAADDAREQAARDFNRRQREARDAERAVEAAERAEHEAARAEHFERELGVHP